MLKMLILVAMLSSGCATAYHKDATIDRKLAEAEASCMERARIIPPLVEIPKRWSPYTIDPQLYDACMRSNGYTR